MSDARTVREALIAQALGDIDEMLTRVDEQKRTLLAATATLNEASDKYRGTVVNFTEQAKNELNAFLERRAGEVAAGTVESQREQLVAVVRQAFNDESSLNARRLIISLKQTTDALRARSSSLDALTSVAVGGFAALGYILQPLPWSLFGSTLRLFDALLVGLLSGIACSVTHRLATREVRRS